MFDQISKRLSSAHLIAFAALVVALGGTAYAAAKIDTEDIAGKAVTKKKLAAGAVTNKKLAAGAVTTDKLADTAVRASKLGDLREVEETTTITAGTTGSATAECNSDERLISGGWETGLANNNALLVQENKRNGNGWRVGGLATGNNVNLTVYAYCLES
jgi:hypothetical protein